MDKTLDVMTEAFFTRLLPIYQELTLAAIRQLQPAAYMKLAVAAGVGALLASVVLYGIGVWLRRMPERVSTEAQQERIEKLRAAANHWLPWLLILSPTPLGGVLIIAAGFFRIHPFLAVLAVIAAEVLWRVSPIL